MPKTDIIEIDATIDADDSDMFANMEEELRLKQDARRGSDQYYIHMYEQLITQFGRNEKCPCNSGKKLKYCCLPLLRDKAVQARKDLADAK